MDFNQGSQTAYNQGQANQQQGLALQQKYINNANQYGSDYTTANALANTSQSNVANYTDYLKGAGSGANIYQQQQALANVNAGYDPAKMVAAQQDALRQSAAMNALSQQQNTPGQFYMPGLSAAQGAAQEQAQLAPVQQGVQNANTVLGQQNTALQNALTQAQQSTGSQLKTQEDVQTQLQNSYLDAKSQADNALSMVQFYEKQASDQGGLNASDASYYAAAVKGYQEAAQAQTQAALNAANAAQVQQGIDAANAKPPTTTTTTTTTGNGVNLTPNKSSGSGASKVGGAAGGAAEGALLGSVVPGLGNILGGALGSTKTGQQVIGNVNQFGGRVAGDVGGAAKKAFNWFENL
jgi:hypothetical protein